MNLHVNMVAYNEERHIEEAIDSILSQSFRDFELVVHDNCSTDRTVEICERIASGDRRLRINRGRFNVGAVLQQLRVHCNWDADYVAFRSANDVMHPDYVAEAMELLSSNPDVGLAYSHGCDFAGDIATATPTPDEFCIDTRGLSRSQACAEVMGRYCSPHPLWGVWRRGVREMCRACQFSYGSDHVLIAEAALYGHVAATPGRLDYRRQAARDGREVLRDNATHHSCEESVRGCDLGSVFSSPKILMPFVDLAYSHIEMLSMARISDDERVALMDAALVIFRARFGERLAMEARVFAEWLSTAADAVSEASQSSRVLICTWRTKVAREIGKLRTLNLPTEACDRMLAQC